MPINPRIMSEKNKQIKTSVADIMKIQLSSFDGCYPLVFIEKREKGIVLAAHGEEIDIVTMFVHAMEAEDWFLRLVKAATFVVEKAKEKKPKKDG